MTRARCGPIRRKSRRRPSTCTSSTDFRRNSSSMRASSPQRSTRSWHARRAQAPPRAPAPVEPQEMCSMKTRLALSACLAPLVLLQPAVALAAQSSYASAVPQDIQQGDSVGGQQTLPIAQSVDEIVDQHMKYRGGYDTVKGVTAVDYEGTRYVGCEHYSLKVHQLRSVGSEATLRSKD